MIGVSANTRSVGMAATRPIIRRSLTLTLIPKADLRPRGREMPEPSWEAGINLPRKAGLSVETERYGNHRVKARPI